MNLIIFLGEIERLRRFWFTGSQILMKSNLIYIHFLFLISGACKSGMAQRSQRSSQPLEVECFLSFLIMLSLINLFIFRR
jgi:hypothetical protein